MELILGIKIKSYGFIDVKRELLHGSAIYGMISQALLDIYGFNKDITKLSDDHPFKHLYNLWKEENIRFFPFIPDINNIFNQKNISFSDEYNKLAWNIYDEGNKKIVDEHLTMISNIQTDFDRGTLATNREPFIKLVHKPFYNYYGIIICPKKTVELIEESLLYFPFLKIGKRGKMSHVESEIINKKDFQDIINEKSYEKHINEFKNITPIALSTSEDKNPTNPGRKSDIIKNDIKIKELVKSYVKGYDGSITEKYRFERYGPYFAKTNLEKPLINIGDMTNKKRYRMIAIPAFQNLNKLNNKPKLKDFYNGLGEVGAKIMGFGQLIYKPKE